MTGLEMYLEVFHDILTFVACISPLLCILVVLFYAGRLLERKGK